jgi:octaprenyl-diphosphate synthase
VVELVHLATLVHDDIMDSAEVRRSRRTAMREFGPTAAVLLGDALFAHALHLATDFPTTEVCAAVSESTRRVCAGEIVQTSAGRSTDLTPADYQRIIDLKTAELFRVSCFLGGRLAGSEDGYVEAATASAATSASPTRSTTTWPTSSGGRRRSARRSARTSRAASSRCRSSRSWTGSRPSSGRRFRGDRRAAAAQPALRLKQMLDLGVFDAVEAAVQGEVSAARAALGRMAGPLADAATF